MNHLRAAKDEIDRHYAEPLDIATLARTALASEAHFIRSFKLEFGETPHRYLQRRRVERAADLLRETDRARHADRARRRLPEHRLVRDRLQGRHGRDADRVPDRHRGAPPPMIPGCLTLMWTRKSSFPEAGRGRARLASRP